MNTIVTLVTNLFVGKALASAGISEEQIPTSVTPIQPSPTPMDISGVIINVINYILGFASALAILFVIIGGIYFIVSAGNDDAATKARKMIMYALLGIVIIVLSFVLVNFASTTLAPVITQ